MTSYESTRQRHVELLMGRLPGHMERLSWSAEQLRAERETRLRDLLRVAREHSPWHRRRLSHIDIHAVREDRLDELPVMTKADLIAHFDEIVTDPRVTLAVVDAHLAGLTGDAYLFDELHAVASGGSSGVRGVFVWGWEAWADTVLSGLRWNLRDLLGDPEFAAGPRAVMVVAASNATHFTAAAAQTFESPMQQVHRLSVTQPLAQIVEGLNRINGDLLFAYSSMLAMLAAEQQAGRLHIAPRRIVSTAEPLLPEIRAAARAAWGVPLANQWGTSEGGIVAVGCYRDDGMHLSDDLLIVEPVDARGAPVVCGEESAKIYLTNLFNPVLPLIRYEISDQVTLLDGTCACGSAYRRIADIQGRLDDLFVYADGVTVHPHMFRSLLGRDARVAEYQVQQTARGADVLLRVTAPVDVQPIADKLEAELQRLGCASPVVAVRIVDELPRIGVGKLKRFVPLRR